MGKWEVSVRGFPPLVNGPATAQIRHSGPMEKSKPMARESTAEMAANISRELAVILRSLAEGRGDPVAEPRLTAAAMAHLLICSKELLQNLLIDTARRPQRIEIDS